MKSGEIPKSITTPIQNTLPFAKHNRYRHVENSRFRLVKLMSAIYVQFQEISQLLKCVLLHRDIP